MNWEDELIEDCREDDGILHPQTDHVLSGAHWMLRRLRTDEAVERVARSINPELWHMVDKGDGAFTTAASTSLASARAAIAALIGDET